MRFRNKIKKIILLILCIGLIGCTSISRVKKLELQVVELKKSLFEKEASIEKLKEQLKENEVKLKEEEAKIQELRKKLELFGVFEK